MFAQVLSLALLAVVHAAPVVLSDYGHVAAAPVYSQPILHAAPVIQKSYYQPAPVLHAPQYVHAPVYQKQIIPQVVSKVVVPEEVDPNPKYDFAYGVSDPHTGDSKNAEEHLENGVIHGSYSLVEPDGHIRKVTYTADHINGFNAVVERTGGAKVIAAAPVAKVIAAPAYPIAGHHW